MNNEQALSIRAKKLGVLIRDARLASGKQIRDCAEAIDVSSYMFGSFERGENSPSLPELEVLSFFLNVPVTHYWGDKIISDDPSPTSNLELEDLKDKRNRIIGALLSQARNDLNLTLKEVSESTGIPVSRIRRYESAKNAIPLPELELLVKALDRSVQEFFDQQSEVGDWIAEQRALEGFRELPPELQEFISKPLNRPYLELAKRMTKMSAEKLREVAETLLEISL